VDVPSSVRISGSKSVSCWLSWAYASRVCVPAQRREECEYTYPAGEVSTGERLVPELLLDGASGVPATGGISSGVDCLNQSGGGTAVPLRLHHVCRFISVPFWQGRHLAVWFWWSLAGCLSIAAFTISNNHSVRQKHPGVPDGSDTSDGTSYPLTENYTLPVALAMGRIPYLPRWLYACNVVMYTHRQSSMCVTLFAVAAVML